jgi:transposase
VTAIRDEVAGRVGWAKARTLRCARAGALDRSQQNGDAGIGHKNRLRFWATMKGMFPFLEKLFADSAYQGRLFAKGLAKILPRFKTEIIKRSDQAKGFVQLPKRWIVERTIAWLNRCRRLAKDWENLNRNALAFLKLASIRLMLRKLCNA